VTIDFCIETTQTAMAPRSIWTAPAAGGTLYVWNGWGIVKYKEEE
jgi:hypothetical protein